METTSAAKVQPLKDTPSLWHDNRLLIRDLYQRQNGKKHTLAHVRSILIDQHRFPEAPLSIYETRLRDLLRLRKKLKQDDWLPIGLHCRKLKAEGRKPQVVVFGRRMECSAAWKEIRRYGAHKHAVPRFANLPPLPCGVVVQDENKSLPPSPSPAESSTSFRDDLPRPSGTRPLLEAVSSTEIECMPTHGIVPRPALDFTIPAAGHMAPLSTPESRSLALCSARAPIQNSIAKKDLWRDWKRMCLSNLPWFEAVHCIRTMSLNQEAGRPSNSTAPADPVTGLVGLLDSLAISEHYEKMCSTAFRPHDPNLQTPQALCVEIDFHHFLAIAVFRLSNQLVKIMDRGESFRSREDEFLWTIVFSRMPQFLLYVLAESTFVSFRAAWSSLLLLAAKKMDANAISRIVAISPQCRGALALHSIKWIAQAGDVENLVLVLDELPTGVNARQAVKLAMRIACYHGDAECGRALVDWWTKMDPNGDPQEMLGCRKAGCGTVDETRCSDCRFLRQCGVELKDEPCAACVGLDGGHETFEMRREVVLSAVGEGVLYALERHANGDGQQSEILDDVWEQYHTFRNEHKGHFSFDLSMAELVPSMSNVDSEGRGPEMALALGCLAAYAFFYYDATPTVQDLMGAVIGMLKDRKLTKGAEVLFRLLWKYGLQVDGDDIADHAVIGNERVTLYALKQLQRLGVDMATLGGPALAKVVKDGRVDTARWLLDAGVDVAATDTFVGKHRTLMGLVDMYHDAFRDMVHLLMAYGAPLRLWPCDTTPIPLVAHWLQSDDDVVEVAMIQHLLTPGHLDSPEAAVLTESAAKGGNWDVLEFLLDRETTPQHPALLAAALSADVDPPPRHLLQRILDSTVDINAATTRGGMTALMAACQQDRYRHLCEPLLLKGARTDLADKKSNTALHHLFFHNNLSESEAAQQSAALKLLLDHGANFDAQAEHGETALHYVAARGDLELAIILLDHGANPNLVTTMTLDHIYLRYRGPPGTPLDVAAYNGRLDMAQLLLNAGRHSARHTHSPYDSAIVYASQQKHREVLELLMSHAGYSDMKAVHEMSAKQPELCM